MACVLYFGFILELAIGFSKAETLGSVWPNVVYQIVRDQFKNCEILFLDYSKLNSRQQNQLYPPPKDNVDTVLFYLNRDWSLLYQNQGKPMEFKVKLSTVDQIIAVVDENVVYNSLNNAILAWRRNTVWHGGAKMLIIVETNIQDDENTARRIMEELWTQVKAVNVVILLSNGEDGVLYSMKAFTPSCVIHPILLGHWSRYFMTIEEFFPRNDFRNLNRCTVKAVAQSLIPYVFPRTAKEVVYDEGIEVRIFYLLAEILNYSPKFVEVPQGQLPYLSLLNGTPTGIMGMVYRGDADVSLSGSRLTFERMQYVDAIDSYFGDDFTWVGPVAKRSEAWKGVFLVFRYELWLFLLISLIISTITAYIVIKFDKTDASLEDIIVVVLKVFVNMGIHSNLLQTQKSRIFFGLLFFSVLIVNSLYASSLYRVLTYGLPLNTLDSAEAAAEAGLVASIYASNIQDLNETLPEYYNYITKNNLVLWRAAFLECLSDAAKYSNCYTLYSGLGGNYFINLKFTSPKGNPFIRVMKTRFKSYEPVLFITKHHPLKHILGLRLRQLVESGIIIHHINDIMESARRMNYKESEVATLQNESEKQELRFEQLLGAFVAGSVALALALTTFITEVFCNKGFKHPKIHGRNDT